MPTTRAQWLLTANCKSCNKSFTKIIFYRSIASICRGNAFASKSITSISKSITFSAKSIAFTKREKKILISNFSIPNFTKNLKFFVNNLLTSLIGRLTQCLCGFTIVTSFRERSLYRSLYRSLQTPSLPASRHPSTEREEKYYRQFMVIYLLPSGRSAHRARMGSSEVSSDLHSDLSANIGHYPQPSIHAPWESFSDLRRLFLKILFNFPNNPFVH